MSRAEKIGYFTRIVCAAETVEEITKYDLQGLLKFLQEEFAMDGVVFVMLQGTEAKLTGIMEIEARYQMFFPDTQAAIANEVIKWGEAHGEVRRQMTEEEEEKYSSYVPPKG